MSPQQQSWLVPLCFLEEINEESIARMIPEVDAAAVLGWFKTEASVRSPTSSRWEVLPIIRSRICEYTRVDSPKRFDELSDRAAQARPSK